MPTTPPSFRPHGWGLALRKRPEPPCGAEQINQTISARFVPRATTVGTVARGLGGIKSFGCFAMRPANGDALISAKFPNFFVLTGRGGWDAQTTTRETS
jgi:hypothetical protein